LYLNSVFNFLYSNEPTYGVDFLAYEKKLKDGTNIKIDFWDTVFKYSFKGGLRKI